MRSGGWVNLSFIDHLSPNFILTLAHVDSWYELFQKPRSTKTLPRKQKKDRFFSFLHFSHLHFSSHIVRVVHYPCLLPTLGPIVINNNHNSQVY